MKDLSHWKFAPVIEKRAGMLTVGKNMGKVFSLTKHCYKKTFPDKLPPTFVNVDISSHFYYNFSSSANLPKTVIIFLAVRVQSSGS
jgi:hypothetical protein